MSILQFRKVFPDSLSDLVYVDDSFGANYQPEMIGVYGRVSAVESFIVILDERCFAGADMCHPGFIPGFSIPVHKSDTNTNKLSSRKYTWIVRSCIFERTCLVDIDPTIDRIEFHSWPSSITTLSNRNVWCYRWLARVACVNIHKTPRSELPSLIRRFYIAIRPVACWTNSTF